MPTAKVVTTRLEKQVPVFVERNTAVRAVYLFFDNKIFPSEFIERNCF
jgi:hypothetical protein